VKKEDKKPKEPEKKKAEGGVLYVAKALEAYKGKGKEQLAFSKGATIQIIEENDDAGTLKGTIGKKTGWFPNYYVKAV